MPANNPSKRQQPIPSPSVSQDTISHRARELWESRGQPSGQDEAIWLEAERELNRKFAEPTAPRPTGRMERSNDDPTRESGAETSARQNAERERDDDPDI